MKVSVTRSGGFAGIPRRAAVEFAMRGERSASDDAWAALYRAARIQSGSLADDDGAAHRMRDAFQWTVRLGRQRVDVPDRTLTGPLRELAERVLQEGA
ncbi:protealysin inhibitor emfourin [Sinomonas sp. JGH33]|uniref:Protealysin inhibitor emfourin n=1 Tax=Sinomonas terricola TaxID=3110330 RepID=A0ABU5T848_9MICC|nr:protealysin inhibitor emfourin [Sinomonas sp. JGH33]MEA5455896.1 protealysin inhibitor emfourin [Sinomonas sp. JGH33]